MYSMTSAVTQLLRHEIASWDVGLGPSSSLMKKESVVEVRQWLEFRCVVFLFQAEDGIRDWSVTGVQTCALPIYQDRRGQGGAGRSVVRRTSLGQRENAMRIGLSIISLRADQLVAAAVLAEELG